MDIQYNQINDALNGIFAATLHSNVATLKDLQDRVIPFIQAIINREEAKDDINSMLNSITTK